MPLPSAPEPTQEELDYWDKKRQDRLAKHPIDLDALETAMASSEEDDEDDEDEDC